MVTAVLCSTSSSFLRFDEIRQSLEATFVVELAIMQVIRRGVWAEAGLRSDAVIGVGRPAGGIVFRGDSHGFGTVVPVVFDERRGVVRGVVSRMTPRGQNRTRTDDYQSRQEEISRHDSQSQIPGVGCYNGRCRESKWMGKREGGCGWILGFSTTR